MAEFVRAIVLGLVQGATEFIPVSSSGHLVIVPWLLGWNSPGLFFDAVLHWGTLVSIFVVFWQELTRIIRKTICSIGRRSLSDPDVRLGWFIVVGSIPAAIAGLLFKEFFEGLFHSPGAAGGFLLVTALLLYGSEYLAQRLEKYRTMAGMGWVDTAVIGISQAFALAPGISRSGITIAAGLARGIRRDDAARFSFLLGTPAFFGAGLLQLIDVLASDPAALPSQLPMLATGFIASAASGFVAIRFLLAYLRTRSLYLFAIYCAVVGTAVLVLTLV